MTPRDAVLLAILLVPGAPAAAESDAGVGYDSVAAALSALRADPAASVHEQDGWTHVMQNNDLIRWTFVPRGHRAWPAVVRRDIVDDGRGPRLETRLLCEAGRPACDALFERLRSADESLSRELGIGR